ncbi:hypothetical protein T03_13383 [Trichinella britovi]|uniref:Uncharacterized protein n=1 Tax=Trichinella britovi TaxID=45882 RepID=A0A0V1CEX9_TRIBR|nr:hypothetical protein T03_13383 [Trichinella britovi]
MGLFYADLFMVWVFRPEMDFTEKLEDFFCATIRGGTSDVELLRAVEVEADTKRLQPEGVDGEANRVMIPRPPPMRRSDQSAVCPAGGRTGTQCRHAVGAVRVRQR